MLLYIYYVNVVLQKLLEELCSHGLLQNIQQLVGNCWQQYNTLR